MGPVQWLLIGIFLLWVVASKRARSVLAAIINPNSVTIGSSQPPGA